MSDELINQRDFTRLRAVAETQWARQFFIYERDGHKIPFLKRVSLSDYSCTDQTFQHFSGSTEFDQYMREAQYAIIFEAAFPDTEEAISIWASSDKSGAHTADDLSSKVRNCFAELRQACARNFGLNQNPFFDYKFICIPVPLGGTNDCKFPGIFKQLKILWSGEEGEQTIPRSTEKAESFIRKLRVFYENDYEITIQIPGKAPVPYDCRALGFQNERTTEWKTLLKIITSKDHLYSLGPSTADEYGRKRKILVAINDKLIASFKKFQIMDIPDGLKFYERCKQEGSGTYKFKFQTEEANEIVPGSLEEEYTKMPPNDLIKAIEELSRNYRMRARVSDKDNVPPEFVTACEVAMDRKILTDKQIEELVYPGKDDVRYDPYENEGTD